MIKTQLTLLLLLVAINATSKTKQENKCLLKITGLSMDYFLNKTAEL